MEVLTGRGGAPRSRELKIGALLANGGQGVHAARVTEDAAAVEAAGFDSIWVSDHVLMPTTLETPYPFTDDGDIIWNLDDPWFDPLIWLTAVATATRRIEIGTNVLLAALRPPLLLAKQLASLDCISGGRLSVGVGAGWLLEEFEALGVPVEGRGRRLDRWMQILRASWTGTIDAFDDPMFGLPRAVHMRPTPAHDIPVLVGGTSRFALNRAADLEAGWIAEFPDAEDPVDRIRQGAAAIEARALLRGLRVPARRRIVYNANEPMVDLRSRLLALMDAGVTDVVVGVDIRGEDLGEKVAAIRDAAAR
jgi:probable F420-dependent oxidoreductase